jgi:RNA polymerase sigma-70 factor (ECF subfamily)
MPETMHVEDHHNRREPEPPEHPDELAGALRRVATGDEEAFRDLYETTKRQVFGLALTILRDRDDAEEATLSTFTRVWKTAHTYNPSRGTIEAWILMLTRSKSIDMLRSRRRRLENEVASFDAFFDAVDPVDNPEQTTCRSEVGGRIREAMRVLPMEQQLALICTYFLGMSHSEAAGQLGVPLGTIKGRIRMALTKLRELLANTSETAH